MPRQPKPMPAYRNPALRDLPDLLARPRATTDFGQVKKKLAPGDNGTKRHPQRHGDRLVCVRYRVDAERGVQYTTVEVVVDERPLAAAPARTEDALVLVRIAYAEKELQRSARAAGGIWQPQRKAWLLPASAVKALKLGDRVVTGNA